MTAVRKLITKSLVAEASLVRRFDADHISLSEGIVGLSTSDFLYWEIAQSDPNREGVIYSVERGSDGDAMETDGFVCNHYDSRDLIHEFGEFSEAYGFMADIEGVLDEGLSVGSDFTLVDGITAPEMHEKETVMMIGEAAKGAWWIYRIQLSASALLTLLRSNTMGYQLGFSLVLKDGECIRLVREIGFDMQSMDLVLTERKLSDAVMGRAVSVF